MAERYKLNELPYGHFGFGVWDEQTHQFDFPRKLGVGYYIESGNPRQRGSGSVNVGNNSNSKGKSNVRRTRQVRNLIRANPEVQPATGLPHCHLQVSEAAQEASAYHETSKGSLLAIGRFSNRASHSVHQIVAFASGVGGSDLYIAQLQNQRQVWKDSSNAWIEAPCVHREHVTWHGPGAPIQQVSFAQATEDADPTSFLASRLLDRTLIFLPRTSQSEPGRLDVSGFASIHVGDTGGISHADVAFNPWFNRQLGIVDHVGSWSIWEFDGRRLLHAKCTSRHLQGAKLQAEGIDDGWARLVWVGGPSLVAICTRHRVSLFRLTSGEIQSQEIDVSLSNGMVLDVKVNPRYPTHLFVLTSAHILLFRVREIDTGAIINKQLAICHYRSPEDVSLKLSLLCVNEDIVVILRSCRSQSVFYHRIVDLSSDLPRVQDPGQFQLSGETDGVQYLDTVLQMLNYESSRTATIENTTAHTYRKLGVCFIQAMSLANDFTLRTEFLYVLPESRKSIKVDKPTALPVITSGRGKAPKENFVIDDSEVEMIARAQPQSSFVQRMRQYPHGRHGLQWTFSYANSAAELDDPPDNAQSVNVDDTLGRAKEFVRRDEASAAAPIRTLLELEHAEPSVPDLDETSNLLQELLAPEPHALPRVSEELDPDVDNKVNLVVRQIDMPLTSDLHGTSTITSMYDSIVATWISSLSPEVSGRVRLAKEQLARRIAAEVTLASHAIRIEERASDEFHEIATTEHAGHQFELPVRGAQATDTTRASSEASTQLVLPTPSPSATPSVTTGSSYASSVTAPEMSRLSKYTTFSKPLPTTLPRTALRLLSHWSVGSDPSTYDWQSTSRRIIRQVEDEEADSQLTEKERARLKRKAERHIKRQRREVAASQQQHMASSQLPELAVSASQPSIRLQERSHTQPGVSAMIHPVSSQSIEPLAASQAVPGRYGTRPVKKRKKGF